MSGGPPLYAAYGGHGIIAASGVIKVNICGGFLSRGSRSNNNEEGRWWRRRRNRSIGGKKEENSGVGKGVRKVKHAQG